MAVKEAEENDIMDDDDDDAHSTSSGGTTDRKDSSRPQHKCSRKPTVSLLLFLYIMYVCD